MASVNTGKLRPDKSNAFRRRFDTDKNGPGENTVEGRMNQAIENLRIDSLYGFETVTDIKERTGFLINMHPTEIIEEGKRLASGVDYYFLEEDCTRFKVSLRYSPYFYALCREGTYQEVSSFLLKRYSGILLSVEILEKEDLDLPNHLTGLKRQYLKLSFSNITDLIKLKRDLNRAVLVSKEREQCNTYYTELLAQVLNPHGKRDAVKCTDQMDNILDIREHDVPHHERVSIDCEIFVGLWYTVKSRGTEPPLITRREDLIEPIEPIVFAYDIETTKLPLKFPDASSDQIMMISYMIDGQGYLITNREIIAAHIDDFEYTPKPEFEGIFTVFNEPNEKATIDKFFNHINEIRPHIFVSYNGDFFDWPFVEARAKINNLDMKNRIGFARNRDDVYACRPCIHMDCLSWVKRDSYLPVGSQGLKAVTKAKLRYNPIEIEPEDMCRFAAEKPETLANYSVSDAVATYYLYQKYVHPFIFALCTIIPMNPDEVLRKGSGTLCEALLMVQAFRANIIYPNKKTAELNKLTAEGHVLDLETYVGGHVEALESGIFRANIPCRFKIEPSAVDDLIAGVENTLKHAIQEEEKVSIDLVTNFEEVADEIKGKLRSLRDQPLRIESPVIYHLDVGAMYPNIILTNRLQPSAMVDETVCAACDFNRPGALCKRNMEWTWRGEHLPASLGEFQRIKQQLETEKLPAKSGDQTKRPYHELSKADQAAHAKERLTEYCRKAYKKVKVTKIEERTQTVCQKENSFYVDTVRAFRDRRYEYKGLTKLAKQQVAAAVANGDASEIKSAKNREILYDSLQLAHKCILNSFYGYVMRRGSRWHSMEMGGIVCHTGAKIIMKAREIIEKVGRPLELDTDGIWCILPASFPDNFIITTTHEKKSKLTISYPNAVLNFMVKDQFTNEVYHELVDPVNGKYEIRSENSIFFEVDGPYLAMVLPAAKEEGKKLKKRYAVFNFDGSVAELKGFEIKRRGELQLIKNFQSSVFESFLKGNTLEECYKSVAKVADYWLDVLYSKGADIPDADLFELISENKSMSRKLEDYGKQKSTSISTAKRLAEFLGDAMVKDAGLACKFIISKRPQDAPVTERAIPLAIFQSEPSLQRHYLRKWLKDSNMQSFDIRDILDWGYYIERLGSAIQKIITIPAAMQGIPNPVPRVAHPDWLHKTLMEKTDIKKQRRITEMFNVVPRNQRKSSSEDGEDPNSTSEDIRDIEDSSGSSEVFKRPTATVNKRKRGQSSDEDDANLGKSWREVLGPPPSKGTTKEEHTAWLEYHKKKWAHQANQRSEQRRNKRTRTGSDDREQSSRGVVRRNNTLGGFLQRSTCKLIGKPWQIIQIAETSNPGTFKLWALVDYTLYAVNLVVPRIFYVNTRQVRPEPKPNELWKKCSKILPRSRPIYNLYKYAIPESLYIEASQGLMQELNNPEIEGIYERQMPLEFRAILQLGCVCMVDSSCRSTAGENSTTFTLDQLLCKGINIQPYLKTPGEIKQIFLYHHWTSNHQRGIWALFLGPSKRAHIYIHDTVRTNQMPNLNALYVSERNAAIEKNPKDPVNATPEEMFFDVKAETNLSHIHRLLQASLKAYHDEKRGPTMLVVQTAMEIPEMIAKMPLLTEFPLVNTHVQDIDNLYSTLDWQRVGAKTMIRHYLKINSVLALMAEQSRYFHAPIGNLQMDCTLFGADLFYARQLQKQNFVLWCSPTDTPDLGGSENDDNRLLTEFDETSTCVINNSGTYSTVSIELSIGSLAVNTLLQSHHVNDIDGTSSFVAFHTTPQASLQDMVTGESATAMIPLYDEIALCSAAFKVLRTTAAIWLRDVTLHKNQFADHQLMQFYRWLRSPNALLYDPALRRTLHTYMKKMFTQLVAEFMRLKSEIIFANLNKIIVCTKKRTIEDALGYINFVVGSVLNKELFHSIEINSEICWEYLIWLDLPNHAGIIGKLPNEREANGTQISGIRNTDNNDGDDDDNDDDDDDTPEIAMNWNLMEALPNEASCRNNFNTIIAGYILANYQFISETELGTAKQKTRGTQNSILSQTTTQAIEVEKCKKAVDFAKKLITDELSHSLFQIVQKTNKLLPEKIMTLKEHPNLDLGGAESKKINPALELIKSVCKVLSLDKTIVDEVYDLQKNLLRLINIGNFSDKAEWKDPCISLVLSEVICKSCNYTRDIDLCNGSNIFVQNEIHSIVCPLCNYVHDNAEIEFALIDILNRKSMAYVLQDLQCLKCKEIKRDNMKECCTCSGELKTMINRDEMVRCVRILNSISHKCKMSVLADAISNTYLINKENENSL